MELLVKKAQQGDAEAFISLIEENKQSMYKVARGILKHDEDIADAISETVLDCYEKICTLKQRSYFKTWMIRILINNCKDMIRKRKDSISIDAVPESEYQGAETRGSLHGFRELVAPLKETDQSIFTLYYVYGLKIREIAACMEMKENTVTSRLKRGRETLRQEMTTIH
ncbi:MAG: sigma-70 family RNA polymerase sigma factor [Lachnospiraceae bacterium]|nr:sigma-70 family RNA polymerase sigma factor [Lachnospiraceae bacterium]